MPSKKASLQQNDKTTKTIIVVSLAIAFVVGYFVARAKYKPQILELTKMVAEKDQSVQMMKAYSNKVMMDEDKMWIVKDGTVKEMDRDVMMSNGDKVMVDGKVLNKDGSEEMMKNGDSMDMDGNMISTKDSEKNDSQGF